MGSLAGLLIVISFLGAVASIGFGIYLFIKGNITNGLLAFILSCLASILAIELAKSEPE